MRIWYIKRTDKMNNIATYSPNYAKSAVHHHMTYQQQECTLLAIAMGSNMIQINFFGNIIFYDKIIGQDTNIDNINIGTITEALVNNKNKDAI